MRKSNGSDLLSKKNSTPPGSKQGANAENPEGDQIQSKESSISGSGVRFKGGSTSNRNANGGPQRGSFQDQAMMIQEGLDNNEGSAPFRSRINTASSRNNELLPEPSFLDNPTMKILENQHDNSPGGYYYGSHAQSQLSPVGDQGRLKEYKSEEDNIVCGRFPHLSFCACKPSCDVLLKTALPVEVWDGIYIGQFHAGFNLKHMLGLSITHVLNLSACEYTKRMKYFTYLNLDVYDNQEEDIKKYFRITNRFIHECVRNGGKILVHSMNGKSRAPAFILAYLIAHEKITYKKGIEVLLSRGFPFELNPFFVKQLEHYDLEKLAYINLKQANKDYPE